MNNIEWGAFFIGGIVFSMITILFFMLLIESTTEMNTVFGSHFVRAQSDTHPEAPGMMCSLNMVGSFHYSVGEFLVDMNSFNATLPCNSAFFKAVNG